MDEGFLIFFFLSRRNHASDVYFKGGCSYGNPTCKHGKPVLTVQQSLLPGFPVKNMLKFNCNAD